MAKTYINTVKYEIKLDFEIDGIVDKPDIIGAIFGQSEGLLGDEMDLKELQKNGKLGRIEIDHTTSMGRTKGTVVVPSSMDMAETSLLAAGIESVDKVGPCEADFKIKDIDDTRHDKRDGIKNRAQELLKKMMAKGTSDTQMLSDELREKVRAADITSYGPDKLPCGPNIEKEQEIIVVEGRADVLNMLRNQIKNVVGMNGSNIPPSIVELCKSKEVTLFIDGDRGGILNARKLAQMTNIDFLASAPDGKEVEELTRKEILQSLKKRAPASEAIGRKSPERNMGYRSQRTYGDRRPEGSRESYPRRESSYGDSRAPSRDAPRYPSRPTGRDSRPIRSHSRPMDRESRPRMATESNRETILDERPVLTKEETEIFKPVLEKLKGSMNARLLDAKNKLVKEVKAREVFEEITKTKKKVHAIVLDGVITKRLITAAEKAGTKYVIGSRKGKIEPNQNVKATAL